MGSKIKRLLSMLLAFSMVSSLAMPAVAVPVGRSGQIVQLEVGQSADLKTYQWFSTTTWASSNEDVATVSDGVVTAVGEGSASVTATSTSLFGFFGAKTTTYTVVVTDETVDGEAGLRIEVGQTLQLEVASSGGITTWMSSDDTVATVDGKGLVTGVAGGHVTILARTTKRTGGLGFFWWGGNKTTTTARFEVEVVAGEIQPTEPPVVTCTVTFVSNGGSWVAPQLLEKGMKASAPKAPVKFGSVFEDWYLDKELTLLYDFEAPVNEDLVLYAAWEDDLGDLTADDDKDGIPNRVEELFGLSQGTNDTDADGIDDHTEIYLIGSDPTVHDSSEDMDNDGLSNYEESKDHGTDATVADTDLDGLTDGQEVRTYGTDPLVYDTDGDGLRDGSEVRYGADPLTADRSFQIFQKAEDAQDSVSASVDIQLSGDQVDTLRFTAVENKLFFPEDMPGYLGMAYDLSVEGGFESANVSFGFDTTILTNGADPVIFRFNAETQALEEVQTTIDGSVASAVVEEQATYILLDRGEYHSAFGMDDRSAPDLETDTDGDGIADFYEDHMVAFNGKRILLDKYSADTDGDGLPDGHEIEVQIICDGNGMPIFVKGRLWSDPTLKDTDYDGVTDDLEHDRPSRMDNTFSGTMLGYYDVAKAEYTFDYRRFFGSKTSYDESLCSASLILSNGIYDECGFSYDHGQTAMTIKELMQYHGFENVIDYEMTSGYQGDGISVEAYTDDDVSEVGIGYHEVTYGGTTKTILGIVIRGSNETIEEWSSNFDLGDPDAWESEYHKGFYTTQERIRGFVAQYVAAYLSEAEGLTYWITGHSRGAALANILAAKLIDEGDDVFAYTFATPATTVSATANDAKYDPIFNFANTSDIVTYVPLKEWEFERFGVTMSLSIEESGLADVWSEQTGVSGYNALSKSLITSLTNRIAKSCCASWDEVHDRDGVQIIDDEQYGYISERAMRYCDLVERRSFLGNRKGYKLYPSMAFVFQLGAEMLAGSEEEKANVMALLPELWNSEYVAAALLFVGDVGIDSLLSLELGAELIGDGHALATYYVLTQND